MKFSIITPSFRQLDWLRLCVASVADQGRGKNAETLKFRNAEREDAEGENAETLKFRNAEREDAEGENAETLKLRKAEGADAEGKNAETLKFRNAENGEGCGEKAELLKFRNVNRTQSVQGSNFSGFQDFGISAFSIEHIIQDGGTPGMEGFAREVSQQLLARYGGEVLPDLGPGELGHLRTASGATVRIFQEPDAGMYDALNKGLERAEGDILAWLNCDEQYLPGTLQKVSDYFYQHPEVDVLLGDAVVADESLKPICYRRIMKPDRMHTRLFHLHALSCAMFFRRSALESRTPFETRWKIIGDAVLVDGFLRRNLRLVALKEPLSVYVVTGINLSLVGAHVGVESRIWHKESGWPSSRFRLWVRLRHVLRRLFHRAYCLRDCEIKVYTPKDPRKRQIFRKRLSWRWPKGKA